ncbi:MAG TPA: CCA tRNA nucleotidyltransferase [Chthoniobacteraceae bacterium]|jgi:poly(A) polymerase|nr:CCA tRNA nucleotidyltransferase [Chthoniobacteraceae bacterium]
MSAIETAAHAIVQRLQDAGYQALYAGGCVRDRLRGVEPHDYDIATDAKPEEVQRLFPRTVAVGAQFGVVCVMEAGTEFEVASFRADGLYIDGRHPESVVFSSPEIDAQRRDFTINGLFFDPIRQELIDYVGGRRDLEAKVLRAIGKAADRFREDRLRMLRAVRFAATLGFEIEPATWAAVRENAAHIREVSPERIRDELVKIFTSPQRVRGLDLLDESGLLREVLPEMERLKGCEQPPQFHPEGDVWVHTRIMLGLLQEEVSAPLVFSVLLHDIGKPATFAVDETGRIRFNGHEKVGAEMTETIMSRLRFSRKEIDATVHAVSRHMIFKDVPDMRVSRLKRFMASEIFDDEMELHRVDCTSSHHDLSNYTFLQEKREEFSHEPLIPEPLVTGRDLIALGFTPGPAFKPILEAVQSRQLEGTLTSAEEAIAWVKEEFARQDNETMRQ